MKCPVCDGKLAVIDTRHNEEAVKRTRECVECLSRFISFEKIDFKHLDPYVRDKLHLVSEKRNSY